MNTKLLNGLFLAGLMLWPWVTHGAETARARLYCLSLQLQSAIDSVTGEYRLLLDHSELWPYSGSTGYAANITLRDDWFGEDLDGYILLTIPSTGDANHDGFPDFFDSTQPVNNVATAGSYNVSGYGSGTLQATWSRAPNSSLGVCALKFKPNSYYTWLSFTVGFQLLEYVGPLTYTPGTTGVTGRVELVQTDIPDVVVGGPIAFVKSTANPFNSLMLQPDVWTNTYQQTMVYTNYAFSRDTRWPTNYYGYLILDDDANDETPYPFDVWMLSIDDLNDANHNGIPDFSDTPAGPVPPRRPQLALVRQADGLQLTIGGDPGHVHQVQEADAPDATSWVTVWSQSLASDPQTVVLPVPAGPTRFWRVVAQ